MKILLKESEQDIIKSIFRTAGQSETIENFISHYMISINTLVGAETYGCFFFMNSLTDKIICIENNPADYFRAYFGGLNKIDLLFFNLFEPNVSVTNYERFVVTNQKASIFFEESKKIKKHGDYYYRPLRFRNQIVGFYGFVLPEKRKNSFGERDLQIMELLEPCFNSGIMQTVLREKARFNGAKRVKNNQCSVLYIYPGGVIELPDYTEQEIICDVLCLKTLNSENIYTHPLIKKLLSQKVQPGSDMAVNTIRVNRNGVSYTVRAMFNKYHLRHGYRFLTMICFEKDKEIFPFNKFALQYNLTKREKEIMSLVFEGYSNKDISNRLCISLDTVKKHLYNIFTKTGVKSRTQLILLLHD